MARLSNTFSRLGDVPHYYDRRSAKDRWFWANRKLISIQFSQEK